MAHPDWRRPESIIHIDYLSNSTTALRIWSEIERRNPQLSVEGLGPFVDAYTHFIKEPDTGGLVSTSRWLDRGKFFPSGPRAIHLVGPTGVGKDEMLITMGIPWVVSDTDRPIESRDSPGVTYNFVSGETFEANIGSGDLIEYSRVRNGTGGVRRYGTHAGQVRQMIDSNNALFAFRTNQDGLTPIAHFCEELDVPLLRVLLLPHCPAKEYIERVRQMRGDARVATAKAEIQWTPDLYGIDVIVGNPFDDVSRKPFRAASALGSWLMRTFGMELPQPTNGVDYTNPLS